MSTNYFNNHSQSRFMPLSMSMSSKGERDGSSGSTKSSSSPGGTPPINSSATPSHPPSRVPSKHFSSTILSGSNSSAADTKSGKQPQSNGNVKVASLHPLRNTWVFWFRQQHAPGAKVIDYEEGIKKISSFSSIETFWSLWSHINPPSLLQPTTDYLLFHSAIRRPVWEDPLNIGGGKWIIRIRKGVADRLWEDLVMAVIGDQFDDDDDEREKTGGEREEVQPDVCGCTISVRQSEDIISLWIKTGKEHKVTSRTKDTMKKLLNLPAATIIEYKSNNDSLNDKSSFRINNADRERDR